MIASAMNKYYARSGTGGVLFLLGKGQPMGHQMEPISQYNFNRALKNN
jgi:hypothetical protein